MHDEVSATRLGPRARRAGAASTMTTLDLPNRSGISSTGRTSDCSASSPDAQADRDDAAAAAGP